MMPVTRSNACPVCHRRVAVKTQRHVKDLDTGDKYHVKCFRKVHGNPEKYRKALPNQAELVGQATQLAIKYGPQAIAAAQKYGPQMVEAVKAIKAAKAKKANPSKPRTFKKKKAMQLTHKLEKMGYDVTMYPVGKKWAVQATARVGSHVVANQIPIEELGKIGHAVYEQTGVPMGLMDVPDAVSKQMAKRKAKKEAKAKANPWPYEDDDEGETEIWKMNPLGYEVVNLVDGSRMAGPFETAQVGWDWIVQHGGTPDQYSVETIEGLYENPENNDERKEGDQLGVYRGMTFLDAPYVKKALLKLYPKLDPNTAEMYADDISQRTAGTKREAAIKYIVRATDNLVSPTAAAKIVDKGAGVANPKAKRYEMECKECNTVFEVSSTTVGYPPFDVECSNCGALVGSEHIINTHIENRANPKGRKVPKDPIAVEGMYIAGMGISKEHAKKIVKSKRNPDPEETPPPATPPPARTEAEMQEETRQDLRRRLRADMGFTDVEIDRLLASIPEGVARFAIQRRGRTTPGHEDTPITPAEAQVRGIPEGPHAAYHLRYANIKEETVKRVRDFIVKERPWRGTAEEKQAKFVGLLHDLSTSYNIPQPSLNISDPEHAMGSGFFRPTDNHIELPHYSVVTTLHEFKHCLQHHLHQPQNEEVARGWSLSLFYLAAPKHFKRAIERGIVFFIQQADLAHTEPLTMAYAEAVTASVPILASLKVRLDEMDYRTVVQDGQAKVVAGGPLVPAKLLYTNAPKFVVDRAIKFHMRLPDDHFRGEVDAAGRTITANPADAREQTSMLLAIDELVQQSETHPTGSAEWKLLRRMADVKRQEYLKKRANSIDPAKLKEGVEVASKIGGRALTGAELGTAYIPIPGVGTAVGAAGGAIEGTAEEVYAHRAEIKEAGEKLAKKIKHQDNPEDESPDVMLSARDLM